MKKQLKHFWVLILLCTTSHTALAQNPIDPWVGEWSGPLEIYNAKGLSQTVTMGLNVAQLSDSSWTWQIVYGEGEGRQERNYELLKTEGIGNYVVDEKNSIVLDLNLIKNGLFSFFQVGKSKLLISYELVDESIHFRTHSVNTDTETKTGGEENVPLVLSWKTGVYQTAVLKKK